LGTGDRAAGLLPALAEPGLLADAARKVAEGKPGGVVFVAGEPRSGRTSLLRAFAERDHDGTKVIAGSFASGSYESWSTLADHKPDVSRVRRIAETTIRLAAPAYDLVATTGLAPALPPLTLVASIDTLVVEILGLLTRNGDESHRDPDTADTTTVWELLRTAASTGPTICVLDDFDHAEASKSLEREIFALARDMRGLPLALVASYEQFDDSRSRARELADTLVGIDRAHRITVGPVTIDDLRSGLGTDSDEVAHLLYAETGGDRELLDWLWREWLRLGIVESATRGWRFVPGSDPRALAPLTVTDRRIGVSARTDDFARLAELGALLGWAALEGPVFTAEALAAAMGRDPSEVIDQLDEALATDGPNAVLTEVPPGELLSDGVWRYRFRSRLDWRALARLGNDEEAARSLKYARALIQVYADRPETARTIAQLLAAGGEPDDRYRVIAEIGSNIDEARWHAACLIAMRKDDWDDREYLDAARHLLAAFQRFWLRMPLAESTMLAEHARSYASRMPDSGTYAEALVAAGVSKLDEPESALRDLTEARSRFVALGRRDDEIGAGLHLALVYSAHRRWDDAEREYRAALDRARATGNQLREGEAQLGLGELLNREADREADSESAFEQSVTLLEGANASISEILRARAGLAWIRWRQRGDPQARDAIAAHLEDISRDKRTKLTTGALVKLAAIDFAAGKAAVARDEISRAISLNRAFDDRLNEALNWSSWGGICMRADGHMTEALVSECVAMLLLMLLEHPDDQGPSATIEEMLPGVNLESELPDLLRAVVLAYTADDGASMRRAVETGSWPSDAPYVQHAARILHATSTREQP
jgi:hypothetical protein